MWVPDQKRYLYNIKNRSRNLLKKHIEVALPGRLEAMNYIISTFTTTGEIKSRLSYDAGQYNVRGQLICIL